MDQRMSRGEMIRRLDDASAEVHERLGNGPLTEQERHTLLQTLERLLPMVAHELQGVVDAETAAALVARRGAPGAS
jgi:hypothetical protein